MNKKDLSERDICTKFITPALKRAGWDVLSQIREEVSFTKGRIIVRGKSVTRGKARRADYVLYYKPNIPIALIEAKDNRHAVGDGMQQALEYAATLDIPFVFSSNGDAFLLHDRTGQDVPLETELPLDSFPKPRDLWARYRAWKGLAPAEEEVILSIQPPSNVWLGVTVENRAHGLPRLDALRRITASVRFISAEPLLEDLGEINLSGIHWVIVGGESGPRARLMQREWVLNIRRLCDEQGANFFFKQWGGCRADGKRRGKKHNGRTLEGRTWDAVPRINTLLREPA